jgi:hypothetical protein
MKNMEFFFVAAKPNPTHGFTACNTLFEVRRFDMAPKLPGTAFTVLALL